MSLPAKSVHPDVLIVLERGLAWQRSTTFSGELPLDMLDKDELTWKNIR